MKKLLLIMPYFNNYHLFIRRALQKQGYAVTLCNERPVTFIWAILHFLAKRGMKTGKIMRLFHRSILKTAMSKGPFDYFLLIRGEEIEPEIIDRIKQNHMKQDGQCIYYAWDAFCNFRKSEKLFPLFDRAFTFDPNDYNTHSNQGLSFLPLFYLNEYSENVNQHEAPTYEYEVATVATYHRRRYEITRELVQRGDLRVFSYIYLAPDLYFKMRLFDKLERLDKNIIKFRKMSQRLVIDRYIHAKAILDIPSPKQKGLTIRTLECLALKKKIITTNETIKNYDFYNPNNICIIDWDNPQYPEHAWFDQPYQAVPEEIVEKYDVSTWIRTLMNGVQIASC